MSVTLPTKAGRVLSKSIGIKRRLLASNVAFSQQIYIHYPAVLLAGLGTFGDNFIATICKCDLNQKLIFHTNIGAPPNVIICRLKRLERAGPIQHDHHGFTALWPTFFTQVASGGDYDRATQSIQRDAMGGG